MCMFQQEEGVYLAEGNMFKAARKLLWEIHFIADRFVWARNINGSFHLFVWCQGFVAEMLAKEEVTEEVAVCGQPIGIDDAEDADRRHEGSVFPIGREAFVQESSQRSLHKKQDKLGQLDDFAAEADPVIGFRQAK